MTSSRGSATGRILIWAGLIGALAVLIAYVPPISVSLSKHIAVVVAGFFALISLGVVLLGSPGALRRLKRNITRSFIYASALALLIHTLVASLMTSTPAEMVYGFIFDPYAVFIYLALMGIGALAAVAVGVLEPPLALPRILIISGIVTLTLSIVAHFTGVTPSGMTLVGTPFTFAIIAGYFALVSLLQLHERVVTVWWRSAALLLLILSLAGLLLSFSTAVWTLMGVAALGCTFFFMRHQEGHQISVPWLSIGMVVISLICVLSPAALHVPLAKMATEEVRPSVRASVLVISAYYADAPVRTLLFGGGSRSFSEAWHAYVGTLPQEVAAPWSDFESGASFLLTVAVMSGALGALLWVSFLLAIVHESIMLMGRGTRGGQGIPSAYVFASLYLVVWWFIYVPNIALFVLLFITAGAVAATHTMRTPVL